MTFKSPWTPEMDQRLMELYLLEGLNQEQIATIIGLSQDSVQRRCKKLDITGRKGDNRIYYQRMGEITDVEGPSFQPVRHVITERVKPLVSKTHQTSLHWSDIHFPFHDPRAVNILYQIAEDLQPDTLVCHGDAADMWQLSNHRPPLETKLKADQIDVQETLVMVSEHLARMVELTNPRWKIFMMGNHEDRWNRLLGGIQQDQRYSQLLKIPKISEVLNLDYLLGLTEQGWQFNDYLEGDRTTLHDRLLVIHGYSSTIWASRAHLQSYGTNVMFGHSHRIQNFTKTDLNGSVSGWNIGCLCDLRPHWRQRPNWQQGFAVVNWSKIDGKWLFQVEQIRIHDGVCIWRDKTYKA